MTPITEADWLSEPGAPNVDKHESRRSEIIELGDLVYRMASRLEPVRTLLIIIAVLLAAQIGLGIYRDHQVHQCVKERAGYDSTVGVGTSAYCSARGIGW